MTDQYIVFEAGIDLGKNIMATAVVRALKKHHPKRKIVVVTMTPEVWLHNPDVYRFYSPDKTNYFYDDFIHDKDTIIMRHDPILTEDFAYHRKHFIEIWCELCKVPFDGLQSSLYFTWREEEAIGKLMSLDKPLFFIQTNVSPIAQNIPEFWATDIPFHTAQQVVNNMNDRGFMTIQLCSSQQPVLNNVQTLNLDARQTLLAIKHSKARLFIDSYAHQVAKVFELPSVVLWIAGKPEGSGYEENVNIKAKAEGVLLDFINSYKEGYDFTNTKTQCPHDLSHIFDAQQITMAVIAKCTMTAIAHPKHT